MTLGFQIFGTGLLFLIISLPFIRGKWPGLWPGLLLLLMFSGGLLAMFIGCLVSLWSLGAK